MKTKKIEEKKEKEKVNTNLMPYYNSCYIKYKDLLKKLADYDRH